MNRLVLISIMALVCASLLSYGCVSESTGGGGGAAKSAVIMKVNNRPVKADEFVKSYMMRNMIRQYCMLEALKGEAEKKGIKIDAAEVTKKIEEQKTQIGQAGMKWEDFLKQQSMTEEEVGEFMRIQLMMDGLAASMVKVSDEDIKKEWEARKTQYIDDYVRENKLPDTEKAKLTFDKVKEFVKKRMVDQQKMSKQSELFDDLTLGINLDLSCIGDEKIRQTYEDLIVNNNKKEIEQRRADEKKAKDEAAAGVKPGAGAPGAAAPGASAPPAAEGKKPADTKKAEGKKGGK